jgi:hypothetical protein
MTFKNPFLAGISHTTAPGEVADVLWTILHPEEEPSEVSPAAS